MCWISTISHGLNKLSYTLELQSPVSQSTSFIDLVSQLLGHLICCVGLHQFAQDHVTIIDAVPFTDPACQIMHKLVLLSK